MSVCVHVCFVDKPKCECFDMLASYMCILDGNVMHFIKCYVIPLSGSDSDESASSCWCEGSRHYSSHLCA